MKKHLVIISSAINAKHGVYHRSTRLSQTIETISSIKQYIPNSDIVILDGGNRDIESFQKSKHFSDIKEYVSYSSHSEITKIQNIPSHDYVKNMCEVYMMKTYFSGLIESKQIESYSRVFKISGRYKLNSNFNISDHEESPTKIVIRGPLKSQFPEEVTGGVKYQYMSRFWSFDSSLIDDISNAYNKAYEDMNSKLLSGRYIDIEHSHFKQFDPSLVKNIDTLGVEGYLAPIGSYVIE